MVKIVFITECVLNVSGLIKTFKIGDEAMLKGPLAKDLVRTGYAEIIEDVTVEVDPEQTVPSTHKPIEEAKTETPEAPEKPAEEEVPEIAETPVTPAADEQDKKPEEETEKDAEPQDEVEDEVKEDEAPTAPVEAPVKEEVTILNTAEMEGLSYNDLLDYADKLGVDRPNKRTSASKIRNLIEKHIG